jgi:hypothetical protein
MGSILLRFNSDSKFFGLQFILKRLYNVPYTLKIWIEYSFIIDEREGDVQYLIYYILVLVLENMI